MATVWLLSEANKQKEFQSIPKGSANHIIFHLTPKGFDSSLYHLDHTSGRVSREEVVKTLKEIEATMKRWKKKPPPGYYFWIGLAWCWVFIVLFPVSVLLGLLNVYVGVVCFILQFLFALWCEGKAHRIKEMALQAIVDRYNASLEERGWKWFFSGHSPKWMELRNVNQVQELKDFPA